MANEKKALIEALQDAMKKSGLAAYLIPSADPHQSEYVAAHWKTRAHFSGFTGSAGILVITPDKAGLWTDSRYFLQAENELQGSGISLCKQKIPHAPEHIPWLAEQLPEKSVVGFNGSLFTVGQVQYMKNIFRSKRIKIDSDLQLEDDIWLESRPPIPATPVFELAPDVTGETRLQKLNRIADELKKRNAGFQLVSTLDDIAWILNIRANDVAYNPVCISYLMVGRILSYLFVDVERIPTDLQEKLQIDGILLRPYEDIVPFLKGLGSKQDVLCDQNTVSIRLYESIPARKRLLGPNFSRQFKAIKNETEVDLIQKAMIKDGVALTKFYRWLDQQLENDSTTEVEVQQKLDQFRKAGADYYGESFPAIVGYKGNGAIIHYHAEEDSCATITADGILLVDSGGQYLQGTTDITRTTTLGEPTAAQKRHFTLVLKGLIALSNIEFPRGTTGVQLDVLARQFLWREGLNYGHGTGHGVGFFLNVHEPPQGFATTVTTSRGSTAFEAGMLTSNEPGYYLEDKYGIRIENLMLCVPSKNQGVTDFLAFESVTLFPIDQKLIEVKLLEESEIQWLNDYHNKVLDQLSPHLNKEEIEWVKQQCKEIPIQ